MLYSGGMYILRATEKDKWIRAVKFKPKTLRQFKVDPVFKIDETVYRQTESMCANVAWYWDEYLEAARVKIWEYGSDTQLPSFPRYTIYRIKVEFERIRFPLMMIPRFNNTVTIIARPHTQYNYPGPALLNTGILKINIFKNIHNHERNVALQLFIKFTF